MSNMNGTRKGKKEREYQYKTFFKFAIALVVMIVLWLIARVLQGAGIG